MSTYKIETVEGIGVKHAKTLRKHDIASTKTLLTRGATKKGRKEIAGTTGIDDGLILKWCNMCDLMRVKGIASEYSELLEVAGVDTVKELRKRKPDNLQKAMAEANAKRKKKLVRQVPGLKQVENWVAHAKELDPVMKY